MEERRVALIGIIVSDRAAAERMNALLHDYGDYIIGRMGIPYQKRGVSVISVAIDAPPDVIDALSEELAALPHVEAKTVYADIPSEGD